LPRKKDADDLFDDTDYRDILLLEDQPSSRSPRWKNYWKDVVKDLKDTWSKHSDRQQRKEDRRKAIGFASDDSEESSTSDDEGKDDDKDKDDDEEGEDGEDAEGDKKKDDKKEGEDKHEKEGKEDEELRLRMLALVAANTLPDWRGKVDLFKTKPQVPSLQSAHPALKEQKSSSRLWAPSVRKDETPVDGGEKSPRGLWDNSKEEEEEDEKPKEKEKEKGNLSPHASLWDEDSKEKEKDDEKDDEKDEEKEEKEEKDEEKVDDKEDDKEEGMDSPHSRESRSDE